MKIINSFDKLNEKIDAHAFTLIYVSSENCSVCKADHPIVQKMTEDYQIPAYEIVADQVPEAVGQLNLFTSPVVLLYYNQKEVHRQARIIDFDELQYRIEQITNL